MILADTNVWIDHLYSGDPVMQALLAEDRVRLHPFVFGEIALGDVRRRSETLRDISRVPKAEVARDAEVFALVEENRLFGRGIGWVDAHLLASARLGDAPRLWTRDKRLRAAAEHLGVSAGVLDH